MKTKRNTTLSSRGIQNEVNDFDSKKELQRQLWLAKVCANNRVTLILEASKQ